MKTVVLGAALLAAHAASPSAQAQPDFTGTWVVEHVEQTDRPAARQPDDFPGGRGGGRGIPPGGGGGRRGTPPDGGDSGRGEPARGGQRGQPPARAFAPPQTGQRTRIAQTPERLIVTTPGRDGEQMMSYALDGRESTNIVGERPVKSKTKWEGVALVTEQSQSIEGRGQTLTMKIREIRSMSEDGKMLLRTTSNTPRGDMTVIVTYVKGE